MEARAAELAARFEDACSDARSLVAAIPDDRWEGSCEGEGWSVAAVAHHIARAIVPETALIEAIVNEQPISATYRDWTLIHANNAQNADRFAACTRREVLDLLQANQTRSAELVRGLSAEQLKRAAVVPIVGDSPLSADRLIEILLIGHIRGHLASLQASLDESAAGGN